MTLAPLLAEVRLDPEEVALSSLVCETESEDGFEEEEVAAALLRMLLIARLAALGLTDEAADEGPGLAMAVDVCSTTLVEVTMKMLGDASSGC